MSPATAEMRATILYRCGSLATRAQPATDPLHVADSKYASE